MLKEIWVKIKTNIGLPFGFSIIYLLLPTSNSGIDGYAYASAVKWGYELIWPHHLLYVPFGRLLYNAFSSVQPLELMKITNALSAGLSLWVLYKILTRLQINYAWYFVMFIGSCFGIMRFATENETYILPVLFSLAATSYFLKYLNIKNQLYLILSGLMFGIGVLFHQIHFFWYAGFGLSLLLNVKTYKIKNLLLFILSGSLLVVAVYLGVYYYYEPSADNHFMKFVLHDLYSGRVQTTIDISNFIMTPISFIRTFIQVHGNMKPLLVNIPALIVVPITFIIVLFICLKSIFKHSKRRNTLLPVFSKGIFWAFILHLMFAFYSVGNAEFMVMLPILTMLWLVLNFDLPTKPVLYISIIILVWNLVFGLSPSHFLDLDGNKQLMAKIDKFPNAVWILNEPQKIENAYEYYNGINSSTGKIVKPSGTEITLEHTIHSFFQYKKEILTDCINNEGNLNRASLLNHSDFAEKIKSLNRTAIDSIEYFGEKKIIYKLDNKS